MFGTKSKRVPVYSTQRPYYDRLFLLQKKQPKVEEKSHTSRKETLVCFFLAAVVDEPCEKKKFESQAMKNHFVPCHVKKQHITDIEASFGLRNISFLNTPPKK